MRLWDNHMHCAFSGDSNTPPEVMIAAAKEKQLAGITFTDHLDWDYKEDPGLFDLDLATYQQQIRQYPLITLHGSGNRSQRKCIIVRNRMLLID